MCFLRKDYTVKLILLSAKLSDNFRLDDHPFMMPMYGKGGD